MSFSVTKSVIGVIEGDLTDRIFKGLIGEEKEDLDCSLFSGVLPVLCFEEEGSVAKSLQNRGQQRISSVAKSLPPFRRLRELSLVRWAFAAEKKQQRENHQSSSSQALIRGAFGFGLGLAGPHIAV
ncbi:hypothetical protein MRB53_008877 [Persea americana]|uniref:Uncharacterized protein n=1 Tax=Persea americana TaxID=3435 RepID=A0ACC2LMS4_PERAE|nr:hypothetical protein MRB53_008877 [Persea americana]